MLLNWKPSSMLPNYQTCVSVRLSNHVSLSAAALTRYPRCRGLDIDYFIKQVINTFSAVEPNIVYT